MRLYELYRWVTESNQVPLMEYKREITASKMKSNILTGLQKDIFFSDQVKDKDVDAKVYAVLSKLEEMDPTKNKQFVPWLAKNYGSFRIEDSGRVSDALTKFVKLKTQISRQGKSVDIGQYDWNSLEAMVDEVTKVDVGNSSTNLNYEHMDDIDVLYSGAYGKLMVPKTEAASCEIGSGTKWCTSSRGDNMFDEYNSKGNLYIWIDKSGDKYQFHFETNQFMNSADIDIPDDTMKYFVNEHPVLSKFFSKMAHKHPLFSVMYLNNPDKDVQLAAVNQDGYAIEYIENPDKDVQLAAVTQNGRAIQYIKNPDKDIQLAAVNKRSFNLVYIENPDKDVQLAAVKQDGYSIKYINNPDKNIQLAAVNKNGYVIEYIENPDKDVQLAAVNKNAQLIKYIENPDKDVQIAAIKNNGYGNFTKPKFSPDVIQWAKENGYIK